MKAETKHSIRCFFRLPLSSQIALAMIVLIVCMIWVLPFGLAFKLGAGDIAGLIASMPENAWLVAPFGAGLSMLIALALTGGEVGVGKYRRLACAFLVLLVAVVYGISLYLGINHPGLRHFMA